MSDLIDRVSDDLNLTVDERAILIPSGTARLIASRVAWAKTYLKQAGLVSQPKRGFVEATDRGRTVLAQSPVAITAQVLQQFPEFMAFVAGNSALAESGKNGSAPTVTLKQPKPTPLATLTPEEQIDDASNLLDKALRDSLLQRIADCSPIFFERLIIDLLLAMGYGGSRKDAGQHVGGTGDGGIDGVINEDQLGLDRIYLQAKRYGAGNQVGPSAVQAFVGALVGKGAQKGVFITTSTFTQAARSAASGAGALRVILIDGQELGRLMMQFGIGVRATRSITLQRVDLDYFEDPSVE